MPHYYDPTDVARIKQLEPLSEETTAQIMSIKQEGQAFIEALMAMPQSAEMTLAKRKIEEAVMWAVKGVTA